MEEDKLFAVKRRLFHEGFSRNNYDLVRETLEKYPELLNASVEAIDPEDRDWDEDDGQTPLLSAIAFSDYEMFRMLVEDFKVDLDQGDYQGRNALWKLSSIDYKDRMHWVDLLLKHGVNIHTATYEGMTPLMLAAKEDYIEMVEKLLDLGVDASAKNNNGANALHWMGMAYDGVRDEALIEQIIKLLLEHGVDINAKNNYGMTALYLAKKYNRPEVAKILLKYGAKE